MDDPARRLSRDVARFPGADGGLWPPGIVGLSPSASRCHRRVYAVRRVTIPRYYSLLLLLRVRLQWLRAVSAHSSRDDGCDV